MFAYLFAGLASFILITLFIHVSLGYLVLTWPVHNASDLIRVPIRSQRFSLFKNLNLFQLFYFWMSRHGTWILSTHTW